jgi:starch phosphorylase
MDLNTRNGESANRKSAESGQLLQLYGVGSTRFAEAPDALYERHLKFDNIIDPDSTDARERFERRPSLRDILSDRWLRTDEAYGCENPKRAYYVLIEFHIDRSLGLAR